MKCGLRGLTSMALCFQDDPGAACAAMGLCRSQQLVMAQYLKQIQSNEIPQLDLAQRVSPLLLNVPQLLFPQEAPKQEAPTPKAASLVCCTRLPLTFHSQSRVD